MTTTGVASSALFVGGEGGTASAGVNCIRVIDFEPPAHLILYEINGRSLKILLADLIDYDFHVVLR